MAGWGSDGRKWLGALRNRSVDPFPDRFLILMGGGSVLFHQIPFVDEDDQAFPFFFDPRDDIEFLALKSFLGIDEKKADICSFDAPDRSQVGIILQILLHLAFLIMGSPGR
jgi:hypothetical protein